LLHWGLMLTMAPFDPARLSARRHLTVIRVMIGHFTWTLPVGDRSGIHTAAERLRLEVSDANAWRPGRIERRGGTSPTSTSFAPEHSHSNMQCSIE
jgi:hypothetical protein